MVQRILVAFAILAVFAAMAGTIPGTIAAGHVTLTTPAVVKGATLKAGEYRVIVFADKATFTMGKESQNIPAKIATNPTKFNESQVQYESLGNQTTISEICLGGTNVRITFN